MPDYITFGEVSTTLSEVTMKLYIMLLFADIDVLSTFHITTMKCDQECCYYELTDFAGRCISLTSQPLRCVEIASLLMIRREAISLV